MKLSITIIIGVLAVITAITVVHSLPKHPEYQNGNEGCVLDNGQWVCVDANGNS